MSRVQKNHLAFTKETRGQGKKLSRKIKPTRSICMEYNRMKGGEVITALLASTNNKSDVLWGFGVLWFFLTTLHGMWDR